MINGIESQSAASQASNDGTSLPLTQSQELRESFLELLTTQLQNQDPLNPLENAEMTSQIAQINTVSGIEQLNQTLKIITGQIDAGQALQAAELVGQGVLMPGNRVLLQQDEEGDAVTTPFGIEMEQPAENVRVTITGSGGEVINRYDIGSVAAGVQSFTWDGLTSEGAVAASGAYTVSLEATDADGEAVDAEALNYAQVQGVTPQDQNGQVRLDLGGVYGQIALDDIRMIL